MKSFFAREPETFEPKLLTVAREGYNTGLLRHDLFAAITVAIVALPLSMAIAIASGVGPARSSCWCPPPSRCMESTAC